MADGVTGTVPVQRAVWALQRIQALSPKPDCLVITGDLVDHGEIAEYQLALSVLQELNIPIHIVPGNHDHAARMVSALRKTTYVQPAPHEPERCYYRIDYPGLRLFCCDSSVLGRNDGELGSAQLGWLDAELGRDPSVPAVLAMHHHPIASGIGAMDRFMLSDARELSEVLRSHPPLVRVLIGHLHRPMSAMFAGSLVTCAPSTYRQVFLQLGPQNRGAYVDEPPAILLHYIEGSAAVTHHVPVWHSGAPMGLF
jgi:3',5'-cyclic AMP phosphodiesterase CpdA